MDKRVNKLAERLPRLLRYLVGIFLFSLVFASIYSAFLNGDSRGGVGQIAYCDADDPVWFCRLSKWARRIHP